MHNFHRFAVSYEIMLIENSKWNRFLNDKSRSERDVWCGPVQVIWHCLSISKTKKHEEEIPHPLERTGCWHFEFEFLPRLLHNKHSWRMNIRILLLPTQHRITIMNLHGGTTYLNIKCQTMFHVKNHASNGRATGWRYWNLTIYCWLGAQGQCSVFTQSRMNAKLHWYRPCW